MAKRKSRKAARPPPSAAGPATVHQLEVTLRDEERREWAGDFDPEAFDLAKVDAAVRKVIAGR